MKILRTGALCAFLALLCACSSTETPNTPAPDSLRQTSNGAVVGFEDRFDTFSWLGIPFAQPPVGELRWRAPQPAAAWQGTLEALSFAPMCPQFPIPMVNDTGEPWMGEEDCLYLNVSAPRDWSPDDDALPVMIWIHGGGNAVGSADLYSAFRNLAARENVITVSIQYRLGILGWFNHPALRAEADNAMDASGNFGTLDTIAALQWVQDNIHAFGGNPGNVTILGESAGGVNVFALLLSPMAENLFHRAISQSGILLSTPLGSAEDEAVARRIGNTNTSVDLLLRLLQADGTASSLEEAQQHLAQQEPGDIMAYLRSKGPRELLAQIKDVNMGMYPFAQLIQDGAVLPEGDALEALQRGEFNRVPVILGTNRDEMKTMLNQNPDYTSRRFGILPHIPDVALWDQVTGHGSDMWKAVGADEPAQAMLSAGHRDIYIYRFDWDEMANLWFMDFKTMLGAGHSLEIPFVFHDLDNEMAYMPIDQFDEENLPAARPLAEAMSAYWGQFARDGELEGWPRWQAEGRYLVFDTEEDGGIRPAEGSLDRDTVFKRLANDHDNLGGQDGVCRAYDNLFGEGAIFHIISQCEDGEECAGSRAHFCSP